ERLAPVPARDARARPRQLSDLDARARRDRRRARRGRRRARGEAPLPTCDGEPGPPARGARAALAQAKEGSRVKPVEDNGRTYRWMSYPVVGVCVDGCEYECLERAASSGCTP